MNSAARMRSDDTLGSLFFPDILAEEEYSKTLQRKQQFKPEEQLMLAVLEDAVFCFQKYIFAQDRKGRSVFQETEDWILENDSNWFFSFNNICEVVGINPKYLRQGLLEWKRKQLSKDRKVRRPPSRLQPRTHMVPYR